MYAWLIYAGVCCGRISFVSLKNN